FASLSSSRPYLASASVSRGASPRYRLRWSAACSSRPSRSTRTASSSRPRALRFTWKAWAKWTATPSATEQPGSTRTALTFTRVVMVTDASVRGAEVVSQPRSRGPGKRSGGREEGPVHFRQEGAEEVNTRVVRQGLVGPRRPADHVELVQGRCAGEGEARVAR